MPRRRALGALVLGLGATACTGAGDPGPAGQGPARSAQAEQTRVGQPPSGPSPTCPGTGGPAAFPPLTDGFPPDFPAPAGAQAAVADGSDPAVLSVRFPSPLPLREATAFAVQELPARGFEIVGGDREPHEADIRFARAGRQGQLRIARVDDCTTFWLVQIYRVP